MPRTIRYRRLDPAAPPPEAEPFDPFLCLVIIQEEATAAWQAAVSRWLVESGCLYMCAWGPGCSTWDDSVDRVNIDMYPWGEIPEDRFVMTTWHAEDTLRDAMFFARHCGRHPTVPLQTIVLLDIAKVDRSAEMLREWSKA